MRVVIIGLGSMGARRARLVRRAHPEATIVGVDLSAERREAVRDADFDAVGNSIEAAVRGYGVEAAFVCTSPATHAPIINQCLELGVHVFSELNLVEDEYERNIALARERELVLFMSSTFLYREEMQYLRRSLDGTSLGAYTYHVGQYLPDWHPWERYTDFFVASVRTSGVREILAIELPWLTRIFGDIVDVHAVSRRASRLEIPYDDTIVAVVEHASGVVGTLAVDVVSRIATRSFDYFNDHEFISWRGTPDSLQRFDEADGAMHPVNLYAAGGAEHLESYASFVVENAYLEEIFAFERAIDGEPMLYDFEDDLRILRIIDQIEGIR